MKRFLILVSFFLLPILVAYILLSLFVIPSLIEKTDGPNTAAQIIGSFNNAQSKDYDLLILGNSGTYRGFNPDEFSIPTYNFSHDNDSYNQIYYKLKYLKSKGKKFKYLLLGVDYFQFSFIADTKNYLYADLLGEEYSRDYDLNKLDIFLQKTNLLEFTRIEYLKNIFKDRQTDIYVKENGQYIKPGNAKSDDARDYSIDRLPLQEHYFKEILAFCKEEKIPVFLCMLPSRSNAVVNYSEAQIKEFNEFIQDHLSDSVRLLDYSRQEGWSLSDYTDIVHLNAAAADRFSKQVSDSIQSLIKLKSDQQEVGLSF